MNFNLGSAHPTAPSASASSSTAATVVLSQPSFHPQPPTPTNPTFLPAVTEDTTLSFPFPSAPGPLISLSSLHASASIRSATPHDALAIYNMLKAAAVDDHTALGFSTQELQEHMMSGWEKEQHEGDREEEVELQEKPIPIHQQREEINTGHIMRDDGFGARQGVGLGARDGFIQTTIQWGNGNVCWVSKHLRFIVAYVESQGATHLVGMATCVVRNSPQQRTLVIDMIPKCTDSDQRYSELCGRLATQCAIMATHHACDDIEWVEVDWGLPLSTVMDQMAGGGPTYQARKRIRM